MVAYVEVAVNVPQVSGVFHYHLPPELEEKILPGHIVIVPFGHQRVQGVLLRQITQPEVEETKAVEVILDDEITLTEDQIALARHIAETTLSPLATCMGLMLPSGLSQQADVLYELQDVSEAISQDLSKIQTQIIKTIQERGPLRGRQIDRALPRKNWRPAARALVEKQWLSSTPVLPPPSVRPKHIRTAQLSVPPEIVQADIQGLGQRPHTQERRDMVLKRLLEDPGFPFSPGAHRPVKIL